MGKARARRLAWLERKVQRPRNYEYYQNGICYSTCNTCGCECQWCDGCEMWNCYNCDSYGTCMCN